jgi:hypothetical protein
MLGGHQLKALPSALRAIGVMNKAQSSAMMQGIILGTITGRAC